MGLSKRSCLLNCRQAISWWNSRFEDMNKRFEDSNRNIERHFIMMNHRFEDMNLRFGDLSKRTSMGFTIMNIFMGALVLITVLFKFI